MRRINFLSFFFASADVDITLKETVSLVSNQQKKIVTQKISFFLSFFLFGGLNNISILQRYTRGMCTNVYAFYSLGILLFLTSFLSPFFLFLWITRGSYFPHFLTLFSAFFSFAFGDFLMRVEKMEKSSQMDIFQIKEKEIPPPKSRIGWNRVSFAYVHRIWFAYFAKKLCCWTVNEPARNF